jgi:hypothetical protein
MFQKPGSEPEAEMFVMAVITVLGSAGVAFYMRFLVALCKECKPRRIGYWVRLRFDSGEDTVAELQPRKIPLDRAA